MASMLPPSGLAVGSAVFVGGTSAVGAVVGVGSEPPHAAKRATAVINKLTIKNRERFDFPFMFLLTYLLGSSLFDIVLIVGSDLIRNTIADHTILVDRGK